MRLRMDAVTTQLNKAYTTPHLSWEDAQTFLAVAEQRSFSAAAKQLGLGQPTISRRIKNLESLLQQQLFERGKFGAMPTAAAELLMPAAEQMAKWATEFNRTAYGSQLEVAGTVKIAAPPGVAMEQLAPFAALLKRKEPALQLEILSSVALVDLTRGTADIAIRTQAPNEPGLVALYQASSRIAVFASRDYAQKIKQPCTWQDLDWISWTGQFRDVPPRPMLEKVIPNFAPVFASDDYLVQKAAAKAGLGAFIMAVPRGFEESELIEIDIGVELPAANVYFVCAKSMQQVPRVRVVVQHLIEALW